MKIIAIIVAFVAFAVACVFSIPKDGKYDLPNTSDSQISQTGQPITSIQIQSFNLNDYLYWVELFAEEDKSINVGYIDSEKDLIEKAKRVWLEEFSYIEKDVLESFKEGVFLVYFDEINDCWLVLSRENFNQNTLGADFKTIIKSDGTVLSVWIG